MDEAIGHVLRGRGGIHQQSCLPQVTNKTSHFAERVLMMWSWGLISATAVQFLAEGCALDEVCSDETKNLAKIGSNGNYSGNCRRDLLIRAQSKAKVLQPMHCIVPILDQNLIQMSNQMIISPSRLVEYMYKEFPLIFVELCGTKRLEQFWTSIPADDPKLISHPMVHINNWKTRNPNHDSRRLWQVYPQQSE